jgi:hypothetical protein
VAHGKDYIAYLLRMWRTRDGKQAAWRASLQQPGTQERLGFATLDELFAFLQQQAALLPEEGKAPPDEQVANGEAGRQSDK